ncbi:MAG: hypothetical protein ACLPPF_13760 [Rhodomicrobium sp.]
MTWRDTIEYWARRSAPLAGAVALFAFAVALILFAPARGAAATLGLLAGVVLGYSLMSRARYPVQIAVLWASVAVTADAAYARLNDQTPVTLANALAKIIDAGVKLSEPLIKGAGLAAGDPRAKVGAVAPDFVWALVLSLIAMIAIGFPYMNRRSS